MATLISFSIDCSKISKNKLEKGKYLKLTASLNDEPSQYGTNVSVWEDQSKEHREAGHKKNYLGNGKVFWYDKTEPVVLDKDGIAKESAVAPTNGTEHQPFEEESEDLPF